MERMVTERQNTNDKRRFRLVHAIRAVEDALVLLDPLPAQGIEVSALERVHDDLAVALRAVEAEAR
jgi:hypothetical protein